jgi:hypothetical protein
MEDLSNVVAQNWQAEFYLNAKIDHLNQFVAQENRTIEAFNASPHR